MSDLKAVPWFCKAEFRDVYDKLFQDDIYSKKEALRHIDVWKARSDSRLPVSINSSADIIEAMLICNSYLEGNSTHTEYVVRQKISFALIRFINFITQRFQGKGEANAAYPIHKIASTLGIPEWIVTLRHEGTHRVMPALSVLTRGAEWALQWLKDTFWEPQIQLTETPVGSSDADANDNSAGDYSRKEHDDMKKSIACLLVAYQQIRSQELRGKGAIGKMTLICKEGRQVVSEMTRAFSRQTVITVEALSETGYLIPSQDQLVHLKIMPKDNNDKITRVLASFWWPLLLELVRLQLISPLVEKFASLLATNECETSKYILIWLELLLSRNAVKFSEGKEKHLFSKSYPSCEHIPWLQRYLHHPNKYTIQFVNILSSDGVKYLNKSTAKQLNSFINAYLGETDSNSDESAMKITQIHTVSDLDKSYTKKDNLSVGSWEISTIDVDWCHLPVGILPGQEPLSLYNYQREHREDTTPIDEDGDELCSEEDMECEDEEHSGVSDDHDRLFQWNPTLVQMIADNMTILA